MRSEIDSIADRAQSIAQEFSDDGLQAKVLFSIGLAYRFLGDDEKFRKYVSRAIKRARKLMPSPQAPTIFLGMIMDLVAEGESEYLGDIINSFVESLALTADREIILEAFGIYLDLLRDSGMNFLAVESAILLKEAMEVVAEELEREAEEEIERLDYESRWYARRRIKDEINEFMGVGNTLLKQSVPLAFKELISRNDVDGIRNLYNKVSGKIRWGKPVGLARISEMVVFAKRGAEIPEGLMKEIRDICGRPAFIWGIDAICEEFVDAFKGPALSDPEYLKKAIKKIGNSFLRGLMLISASDACVERSDAKGAEKSLKEALGKIRSDENFGAEAKDRAFRMIFERALRGKMFSLAFDTCMSFIDTDERINSLLELCSRCEDPEISERAKREIFSIIDSRGSLSERYGLYLSLLEEHGEMFDEEDIHRILSRMRDIVKSSPGKDWENIYFVGRTLALAIRYGREKTVRDMEKWFEKASKKGPEMSGFKFDKELAIARILHARGEDTRSVAERLRNALHLVPTLGYDPECLETLMGSLLTMYDESSEKDVLRPIVGEFVERLVEAKKRGSEVDRLYENLILILPNMDLHEFLPPLIISAPIDILDSTDTIDALVSALASNKTDVIARIYEGPDPIHRALAQIAAIRFDMQRGNLENVAQYLRELVELAEAEEDEEVAGIILHRSFESIRSL